MAKQKTAEEQAQEWMNSKMGDVPEMARRYLKYRAEESGFCGEVMMTAWAHYAELVLGLPRGSDAAYWADGQAQIWFMANNAKEDAAEYKARRDKAVTDAMTFMNRYLVVSFDRLARFKRDLVRIRREGEYSDMDLCRSFKGKLLAQHAVTCVFDDVQTAGFEISDEMYREVTGALTHLTRDEKGRVRAPMGDCDTPYVQYVFMDGYTEFIKESEAHCIYACARELYDVLVEQGKLARAHIQLDITSGLALPGEKTNGA